MQHALKYAPRHSPHDHLTALYDYGLAHPEILKPSNCSVRTINYVVELDRSGNYVGIRDVGKMHVTCPDMGSATRGTGSTANVLVEKASISLRLDTGVTGDKLRRLTKKQACFVKYFEDGEHAVPELRLVRQALTNGRTSDAIQSDAKSRGVKPSDAVGFSVNGMLLSDIPAVMDWWSEYKAAEDGPPTAIDCITGKPCRPARIMKPIPAHVLGGQGSATLICYDKPSFESYGCKQCVNAPMSQRTYDIIADALTDLTAKGTWLGHVKFLHWYEGPAKITAEKDVLDILIQDTQAIMGKTPGQTDTADVSPEIAEKIGEETLTAIFTAKLPDELRNATYHVLAIQPVQGRIIIREYGTGLYGELHANIMVWFDGLRIVNPDGTGFMRQRKLRGMLYALLTKAEKDSKDPFASMQLITEQAVRAIVNNDPLPDTVAAKALKALQSGIYKDGSVPVMPLQWLKAWVARKNIHEGDSKMSELNREHGNKAYHCGRLMALYEKIQTTATPDMNSGTLTRFYAACSQTPALVLGNMQAAAVHHMDKINSDVNRNVLASELEAAWDDIGADIPKTLSMEDKAYFAMGYWHQRAATTQRIKATWAEIKARKAAGQNPAEEPAREADA